jgi:hypothetical protein
MLAADRTAAKSQAQKRDLENSGDQARFMASGMINFGHGVKSAGRLQTATERIPLEPRLKGGVPLGTFR